MRPFKRSTTENHAASPVLCKPSTPLCTEMIPFVENQNLEKPHRLNLTFWKIKFFGWVLEASRPLSYAK